MTELDKRIARVRWMVCDVDGVLTDGALHVDGQGRPFRSFNVRDGVGLALWRNGGGKAALVSGLASPAVAYIAADWPVAACRMGVTDKLGALEALAAEHGFGLEAVAFLGDDLIDLNAMGAAGLAVCPADAAAEVRDAADLMLDAPGGGGAVRELAGRLLRAQGRYEEALAAYRDRNLGGR